MFECIRSFLVLHFVLSLYRQLITKSLIHYITQRYLTQSPKVFLQWNKVWLMSLCLQPVFDRFEVLELQLGVDDAFVAHGVDRAVHMGDVAVVEAAQYVDDGVRVADVGEELVAQSFAFRRAFDQSGDIDDFDGGRNHPLGFVDLGQLDEPPVFFLPSSSSSFIFSKPNT